MRDERTVCLRTQPWANKPRLGSKSPTANSPPAMMLAASSGIRSRPPSRRASAGGSGCDLPRASRFGFCATKFLVIGQVPISTAAIGSLGVICTLGCLGRRTEGLFPAVRATLGAEPARSGKGCRDPVAPLRAPWLPSRSNSRRSATCVRSMCDETTASRERNQRRKIRGGQRGSEGASPANGDACYFQRGPEASV